MLVLVLLRGCGAELQAASQELASRLLARSPEVPLLYTTPTYGQGYRQCLGREAVAPWDGGQSQGYP